VSTNGTYLLKGYTDAWTMLQHLVYPDEYNRITKELYRLIDTSREYVYTRKHGVDVFFVPCSSRRSGLLDLIVAHYPPGYQPPRPERLLEKVLKQDENKLRKLWAFEKTLLHLIGPLAVDSK
jgi:hypothetical protein